MPDKQQLLLHLENCSQLDIALHVLFAKIQDAIRLSLIYNKIVVIIVFLKICFEFHCFRRVALSNEIFFVF